MFGNPNKVFTNEHLAEQKQSHNNLLMGEIVDLEGDGGYRANLIQQYAVRLMGYGTILAACKVAVSNAGYNGTGDYHTYNPGDVVLGIPKDGMLEEFIIIGGIRLNGDHKQFFRQGQGLKPGELVKLKDGEAPANQVAIHPARATKPNVDFKMVPGENIKTEFEDPIFFDALADRQNAEPLIGGVMMQTSGGDLLTYGYGSIFNYSDGSNIIMSNGTSENKCTRHLKVGKRHSLISQFLAIFAPKPKTGREDYTVAEGTVFNPFDAAVVSTFTEGEITINTNKAIDAALGLEDKSPTGLTPVATSVPLGDSEIVENPNHPAPTSYRRDQHALLAELNVAQAEICNRTAAAAHSTAGGMTPTPNEASNTSTNPDQKQAFVHPDNKTARNIIPGCEGHIKYPEAPAGGLVDAGNGKKLRSTAAKSFKAMQADAKKAGISLTILSGFRSVAEQKTVFFSKGFANKDKPTEAELKERCKVSAPAGYSEHSTGYAMDVNSLEFSFEDTKEYRWLKANAKEFGWVLSFTKDQNQVAFEPWHWKYIGGGSKNPNAL